MSRWQEGNAVQLRGDNAVQPHQPWGSDAYLTAHFWRLHALALHLPRHFPEHVSDADIEATTRYVVEHFPLPWEIEME